MLPSCTLPSEFPQFLKATILKFIKHKGIGSVNIQTQLVRKTTSCFLSKLQLRQLKPAGMWLLNNQTANNTSSASQLTIFSIPRTELFQVYHQLIRNTYNGQGLTLTHGHVGSKGNLSLLSTKSESLLDRLTL